MPDFRIQNEGSISLLRPLSANAVAWIEEHIGRENGYQPYFPTIVIENRYLSDIVAGIQNDGLEVA